MSDVTTFYPDIYSGQAGINLAGALAVCAKATQGTNYRNPAYPKFKSDAHQAGAVFFAYHFLTQGNADSQAKAYFSYAGDTPCMIDMEPTTGSRPTIADCAEFIHALRQLGGTTHLMYLPHWYWQQIGSPSLQPFIDLGMHLVSSNYTAYTANGPGWEPYGGMTPAIWQFSSSIPFGGFKIDFNAFKGNAVELMNLAAGKAQPKKHWRVWHTEGHSSLAEVGHAVDMAPATILRRTVHHFGEFDRVIAGYVNDLVQGRITADDKIPAGGNLWVFD